MEHLDFTQLEERKAFIETTESGLYEGKDVDGRMVIVLIDKGVGMTVKTLNDKGWYEVVDYDEDGYKTDETLEKA